MDRIADRNVTRARSARCLVLGRSIALAAVLMASAGYAQESGNTSPAKPTAFSGCVQKASGSGNTLIISGEAVCATLKGKLAEEKLIGHQVDLKGVLTARTASVAASIEVQSVEKIGESCSDVCKLQPPGTRGLRPPKDHEIPGTEGGTPGVVAPPHK
jgi:hypothetical protein